MHIARMYVTVRFGLPRFAHPMWMKGLQLGGRNPSQTDKSNITNNCPVFCSLVVTKKLDLHISDLAILTHLARSSVSPCVPLMALYCEAERRKRGTVR